MNRVAILALEPINNSIIQYQRNLIKEMKKVVDKVIVIASMPISIDDKAWCLKEEVQVEVSCSKIDVMKWRNYLLEHKEWIATLEQMVLLNDHILGPLCSLEEVFSSSKVEGADFWGISINGKMPYKKNSYLNRFIHKYFMVISNPILQDEKFYAFFEKLKRIYDDYQATIEFESIFTDVLQKWGYTCKVLCDTTQWEQAEIKKYMPFILYQPYKMIKELNMPFVSVDLFQIPKEIELCYNDGRELSRLIKYIEKETTYDVGYMYEYMYLTMDPYDIWQRINANFSISLTCFSEKRYEKKKVVVVAHLFYEDLFEQHIEYLKNVPNEIDIIISCSDKSKIGILEQLCKEKLSNNTEIVEVDSRGREWRALLLDIKIKLQNYEYFCFIHDKKSSQMFYQSVGECFNHYLWENMLGSKPYVYNIIEMFEQNRHLGALIPPTVYFGEFWGHSIDFWTICYDGTIDLAHRLGLNSIPNKAKPVLSVGTAFWARTKSFSKLFLYEFNEEDFPQEPMAIDGTLNHCLERIIPYVVQSSGFYTGVVMTEEIASVNEINMRSMMQRLLRSAKMHKSMDLISTYSTAVSFDKKFGASKKNNIFIRILRKINKIMKRRNI